MSHIGINTKTNKNQTFQINQLVRHAAVLGSTGSGKTVMCKVLCEEALQKKIPIIAIDPKGDLGTLGLWKKDYDFRPFLNKNQAQKTANLYHSQHTINHPPSISAGNGSKKTQYSQRAALSIHRKKINTNSVSKNNVNNQIPNINTTIYTPQGKAGEQFAIMPSLTIPKKFNPKDEQQTIELIEPIATSLLHLTKIKDEKYHAFITQIIQHAWNDKQSLEIKDLINIILDPPFNTLGSLPLHDVINEKERKKLAAKINLLLSSPSKRAWMQGSPLDIASMLSPSSLNVIDLRSTNEKEFVVAKVLTELFQYFLQKGGSQKLKAILYIDEIAGLLPAPPKTSACKKILETLIRQARAFGLGIILATQNPGDIDYKVFSNIGYRFIGKLRTAKDIEKVASAMEFTKSTLSEEINTLKTGQFIFHNAVTNKKLLLQSRWLHSYHGGPLNDQQIGWMNNPKTIPKQEGKLTIKPIPKITQTNATQTHQHPMHNVHGSKNAMHASEATMHTEKNTFTTNPNTQKKNQNNTVSTKSIINARPKNPKPINTLVKAVKQYANETKLKVALKNPKDPKATNIFIPHLKIVVQPKPMKGYTQNIIGPYIYDLTTPLFPTENYLKKHTWSQNIERDIEILPPKRGIAKSFDQAISEAKSTLRKPLYQSTISAKVSDSFEEIVKTNQELLTQRATVPYKRLLSYHEKQMNLLKQEQQDAKYKIRTYTGKIDLQQSKDLFFSIFKSKQSKKSNSKQLNLWMKRVKHWQTKLQKITASIQQQKDYLEEQKDRLTHKINLDSQRMVKQITYRPTRDDLIIHATICLTPMKALA